jgi:hypothetical protein
MANLFLQAFQQAPWRVQAQRLGLVFMGLVVFGLTAGVYLSISASAYAAGVEVQRYEYRQEELQRDISNRQTQKAMLISSGSIEKRAKDLGFEVPAQDSITYLLVPGYTGQQLDIKTSPAAKDIKHSLIKPAFTQSLWEYLVQSVLLMGSDMRTGGLLQ